MRDPETLPIQLPKHNSSDVISEYKDMQPVVCGGWVRAGNFLRERAPHSFVRHGFAVRGTCFHRATLWDGELRALLIPMIGGLWPCGPAEQTEQTASMVGLPRLIQDSALSSALVILLLIIILMVMVILISILNWISRK